MSKCDISIEFDRKDRTYSGGETVTGKVRFRVNETVKSNGITLMHQWRTHGRGNTTSGPKEKVELASIVTYTPGEEFELPFSVVAPTHPVTYRGNLINIDHYIHVEMAVPWAFNPKQEEDYVLRPGPPPEGFEGSRDSIITLAQKPASSSIIGKIILAIIGIVILIPIIMFAAFLLPIIMVIVGIFWFRRMALAKRLGEVKLTIPDVIVAPGEQWTARVQFTPRKQFRINSISLTLLGRESATSGSGTNSTTHKHTILEQKLVLRANDMLPANELVDEEFSLVFPGTAAYTTELPDNKIQWTAVVRIDIPSFPDWSKTQPLQVVPAAFLVNVSEAVKISSGQDSSSVGSSRMARPPASVSPPPISSSQQFDSSTDADTPETWEEDVSPGLAQLVTSINAAPRHGNERGDIVSHAAGQAFDAIIVIDRVTSLMGSTACDPRYEYGKSVTGTIEGTNQAVQVITPESQNDEIDDLRRGDIWQTQISITDWDSLYNRINARMIDENA